MKIRQKIKHYFRYIFNKEYRHRKKLEHELATTLGQSIKEETDKFIIEHLRELVKPDTFESLNKQGIDINKRK